MGSKERTSRVKRQARVTVGREELMLSGASLALWSLLEHIDRVILPERLFDYGWCGVLGDQIEEWFSWISSPRK
jgi:hypothetical protein